MIRRHRFSIAAGLLAAAVALGVGELVAAVIGAPSLVVSVADIVVDYTPGSIVHFAIDQLGSNDKPALLVTITLLSMLIGAALGPLAVRSQGMAIGVFVAFGLVGFAAEARDPLNSMEAAAIVAVGAALAGYGALIALVAATPKHEASPIAIPGRGTGSRRRFLAFAGGATAAAAATGIVGRRYVGPSVDVDEQRAEIVLPPVDGGVASTDVGLDVEGIAPLITPNADFYRIDTAFVVPSVDADTWRLKVTGMVDSPFELTFAELLAMATLEESVTLSCVSNEVGGDLVGNAIWQGVPLAEVLKRAGVQDGATQLVGRSVDGFTAGFPTEVALDGRPAMIAIAMNGEPLPARHGYPARLVVPGLYGYVSATKWLSEIELTTLDDVDGYWIPRGWDKLAPIKTQSRIDVPRKRSEIAAGSVPIAGVAWGGIRSISRVEVRVTPKGEPKAATWLEARLSEALSQSTWRQWVVDWQATEGEYEIEVRATDGEDMTQTEERSPAPPSGATGWHTISVKVRA